MTSTRVSQNKQKLFAKVINEYEKAKPFLNDEQKRGIEFEIRLARFKINHPGKKYYIDQNLQPVLGIMESPWCKLCQKNLDEMRQNDPRCRVIDFCSPNCRKEHNRRKKIRETWEGTTDVLMWNHPKDEKGNPLHLYRKDMFYFTRNGKKLVRHNYKARIDRPRLEAEFEKMKNS